LVAESRTAPQTTVHSCHRLQWGRDQLVAERRKTWAGMPYNSMLQWGRDQLVAERAVASAHLAARAALQWGRDQLVAERPLGARFQVVGCLLQWGRDQLVAERRWRRCPIPAGGDASMGPRPIGRGEWLDKVATHNGIIWLQWGRDQLVAERCKNRRPPSSSRRFNGAATNWSRRDAHPSGHDLLR